VAVLVILVLILILAFYSAALIFLVRERRGTGGAAWVVFPVATAILSVALGVVGAVTRQPVFFGPAYAGLVFAGSIVFQAFRAWKAERSD
jgi:hypothetical protein